MERVNAMREGKVTHRRPDRSGDAAAHERDAVPMSDRNRPKIPRTVVARSRQRLFALLGADPRLVRVSRQMRTGAHELGPGLITGVADDDPSGISTYTVTGATYGYQLLWMSLVTFPMNFAVQSMCARIGLVTGRGLAGVIRERYGRRWLAPIVLLLLVANVVNIGADLHAIAAVVELLTGVPALALIAPIGVAVALTEIVVPYALFARYLKILTLVIFAYVIGAFVAQPDWTAALTSTVVPASPWTGA